MEKIKKRISVNGSRKVFYLIEKGCILGDDVRRFYWIWRNDNIGILEMKGDFIFPWAGVNPSDKDEIERRLRGGEKRINYKYE